MNQDINNIASNQDNYNTLIHSLRMLNKRDIIDITSRHGMKFNTSQKYKDIKQYLISRFIKNQFSQPLFNELREFAFTPDLDVLDGFFLTYNSKYQIQVDEFLLAIHDYNSEETSNEMNDSDEICQFEIVNTDENRIKLLATVHKNHYFYDTIHKLSKVSSSKVKSYVEIYFNSNIIYFQLKNTVIYGTIKSSILKFFKFYFNDNLVFEKPKLSQSLSLSLMANNSAITFNNINPTTIKLLDIIFELENNKYNFSGFSVIDIKFDHEESTEHTLNTRIKSISINGENLSNHGDIIEQIKSGRLILEINLMIEYNDYFEGERVFKHLIEAGISYEKNYFRLYINDSETNLIKDILSGAYFELKNLFISSYSNQELKNEDKIKNMLIGE